MPSILDRIFAAKREELDQQKQRVSLASIIEQARLAPPPRDFSGALSARFPAIIAEVKRASPSKGDILPDLDPAAVARDYRNAGASALSVLTDRHFKGSLDDLRAARAAIDLPTLRKDFIFDEYQLYEARAAGADCILLIVAMLDQDRLATLHELARELRLAALVEVHNRDEFSRATALGAELIGINNRDLHTFRTDLATTEYLLGDYFGNALMVSESGINSAADIERLGRAGARAFLIGESLLRGGNPAEALMQLIGSCSKQHPEFSAR
jgi:indole-3-glycerol phosphate synthase